MKKSLEKEHTMWLAVFIGLALSKMVEFESRYKKKATSGRYNMEFERQEYYLGHMGEDYDVLRDYKGVDGGFNITFNASKNEIKVYPDTNANTVVLTIARKTPHFAKKSRFSIVVGNGNLYDIFMDEIKRRGVSYTVLALRMKDEGIFAA